jgi:hypothetical protein
MATINHTGKGDPVFIKHVTNENIAPRWVALTIHSFPLDLGSLRGNFDGDNTFIDFMQRFCSLGEIKTVWIQLILKSVRPLKIISPNRS